MIAVNELKKLNCNKREVLEPFLRLLAPFAPFTTEELSHLIGASSSVHLTGFPEFDESYLVEDEVIYPISINGKKRGEMPFPTDASKEDIEESVRSSEIVTRWSEGKQVRRIIVVPGRMVNVVVG